ncbi:uncharacterized protein [Montipora capricornis]|uniref:uncharacterized protein isoform X2 n=1 Tax=Montipora capricornis TaxID=246305 RepID=UPI0035F1CA84
MKLLRILIELAVAGCVYSWSSCREIKAQNAKAVSGVYTIYLEGCTEGIDVYCEMALEGGGFTFLPRHFTRMQNAQGIVDALFTDKKKVLLKLMHRHQRTEYYTLIKPLDNWKNVDFGVRVNGFSDYTKPKNYFMRDYILLGIIPRSLAAQRNTIQGFTSNNHPVSFRNCDGNPNSLFAFMPNHEQQPPSRYHSTNLVYEKQGVAVDWRKAALPIDSPPRTMPNQFFFLTELHFGGCGCYTSSDRWSTYHATAIGVR